MNKAQEILERLKRENELRKYRKNQQAMETGQQVQGLGETISGLPGTINKAKNAISFGKNVASGMKAGQSFGNAIKGAKAISEASKLANTASNVAKTADTVNNIAKTADTVGDVAKTADTIGKAGKVANFANNAGSVLGGLGNGITAGANFAKGDYVNGALDAAQLGLQFVPGVGQVASVAIEIGQMLKSAIDEKKQKQHQENLKKMAENKQLANEKKQEAIENFGDNSLAINTMPQQNMLGGSTSPVNTLDGQILPTKEETSLPESPVSSDALGGVATGPASDLGDISAILDKQDNANLGLSIPDAISMATTMGYGKPDIDSMLQGLNGGSADKASLIDVANINKPTTPDEIFSAKMGDFNTAEPQTPLDTEITPNDPTEEYNQPSIADYAKQEISGQPVQDSSIQNLVDRYAKGEEIVKPEVQSTKDRIFANVKDAFGQLSEGYKDNSENAFKLTNLLANPEKTVLNRVGEVVGTGRRLIADPKVQGLVAGAIKGARTGDWGEGLEYGINWASDKAKADNYYKMLNPEAKVNPIINNYGADDYKAVTNADYRNVLAENNKRKIEAQLDKTNPKAIDYAEAMLASGEWDVDKRNDFLSQYKDPTQRINLEVIKTDTNRDKANNQNEHWKRSDDIASRKNDIMERHYNNQDEINRAKAEVDSMYKSGMLSVAERNAVTNRLNAETKRIGEERKSNDAIQKDIDSGKLLRVEVGGRTLTIKTSELQKLKKEAKEAGYTLRIVK